MSSPDTSQPQSQPAAAGAPRPCGTKEACSFLNKFVNGTRPGKPKFPVNQDPTYWLDALYQGYVELYLAVARLEKKEYGMNYDPNDSIVDFPGKQPPGDKAGCPPPPGFP